VNGGSGTGPGGGKFQAKVGLLAVIGLLYASACGGPYGTENYVVPTGPGLLILLLFIAPWLYGVPLGLATAELASARPVEGGYLRWVREVFGEFWGFQAGAWTLIASFLDNALYPVLFAEALKYWIPGLNDLQKWLAAVAFIAILTYLNYRGIRIAGGVAVALNVFLIAPLVWIVAAGLLRATHNPFVPFMPAGADPLEGLGEGLALAIWFYSGFTELSSAAEEMERPERNIPLALLIVTPLVVLSYAAPMIAGLASYGEWQTWESGQFARIGEFLGGPILGQWAFLASVAGFAVIFMSFLLWYSRLAWAMAADRGLPSFLTKLHPRYGTPYRTLLLYATGYALLAYLPFDKLLVIDLWVFGAYDLLIIAAVIGGRRVYRDRAPGFRIPGGTWGAWINFLVPLATWLVSLVATARDYIVPGTAALMLGPIVYVVLRLVRGNGAGPAGSSVGGANGP
jgi:amino acid transporter